MLQDYWDFSALCKGLGLSSQLGEFDGYKVYLVIVVGVVVLLTLLVNLFLSWL